jgi:thioredoxin reductase (NADPH)
MPSPLPIETSVLVIGAGPVGLFAVVACGMAGLKCCVVDALSHIGGQCQALYPDKPIYDIPCFDTITGAELVQRLNDQVRPFDPRFLLNTSVVTMTRQEGRFIVETSTGQMVVAKSIIICGGSGALTPNRPPIDGIDQFEDRSVFYSVTNQSMFADKNIVIAGGGDSAVDWALILQPIARTVHLVHRRDKFRAQSHSFSQLKQLIDDGKVHFHSFCTLHDVHGAHGMLDRVSVKDKDNTIQHIDADFLLPFFGLKNDLGAIGQWGLETHNGRICIDPTTGATNQPGIYVAGDMATYAHKQKLIMTGFAEAAQIAPHLKQYLFPEQVFHFQHSTSSGRPETLV